MITYQKEKIENAICFFAFEHKKKTKRRLSQTFLYKYLALFDFKTLDSTGQPALGLKYMAMDKGPVPIDIYEKRNNLKEHCFEFKSIGDNVVIVEAKGKPDLDYFSKNEIKLLNELIFIYANNFIKTKEISEASHQEIRAWRKAYHIQKNSIINFKQQFDDKLHEKDEKSLTFAEQGFLIYLGLKGAC